MKNYSVIKRSIAILGLFLGSHLLLGQNISWTEQTSSHVLPDGVRLFKGTRTSPILEAWYLDVDLNQPDLMIRSYMAGSSDIVPDLQQVFGAYAAINGGYFGGSVSYSAVIYPNEVVAQNIGALTRNGQSYPVMRSLFSLDLDRQPAVNWIYHYGNLVDNVYGFAAPMNYSYNQSSPLPAPAAGNGEALDGLLVGIGGGPTLVKNGAVHVTYDEEIFWGSGVGLDNGDPRSAVGYTEDQHVILFVVDGRQSISQGLGLNELAANLVSLGCVEAMNLDGGGSTGLSIGGDYVNHPSENRSVPSILAVVHSDSVQIPETPANEIIIDTGDLGGELIGEGWFPSANLGYWGTTPSLLNPVGTGDKTATFSFHLSQPVDEAEVFAWWVAASNRAANTPIVVEHALGRDTVYVDQTTNHGQWNSLGIYSFSPQIAQAVIVSNMATGGDYVVADAVRIISEEGLNTVSVLTDQQDPLSTSNLLRAFPNPFNPTTQIRYTLTEPGMVSIEIVDLAGHHVATLTDDYQIAASHQVDWSAKGDDQSPVATGVYFVLVKTSKTTLVEKILYLK